MTGTSKYLNWTHFSPKFSNSVPFSEPQGVKNSHFLCKIGRKLAFALKLHLKDGFQTWVKYIYSESTTYTLHESIIGLAQSNPVCEISYLRYSPVGHSRIRSEISQKFLRILKFGLLLITDHLQVSQMSPN